MSEENVRKTKNNGDEALEKEKIDTSEGSIDGEEYDNDWDDNDDEEDEDDEKSEHRGGASKAASIMLMTSAIMVAAIGILSFVASVMISKPMVKNTAVVNPAEVDNSLSNGVVSFNVIRLADEYEKLTGKEMIHDPREQTLTQVVARGTGENEGYSISIEIDYTCDESYDERVKDKDIEKPTDIPEDAEVTKVTLSANGSRFSTEQVKSILTQYVPRYFMIQPNESYIESVVNTAIKTGGRNELIDTLNEEFDIGYSFNASDLMYDGAKVYIDRDKEFKARELAAGPKELFAD